MSNDWAVRAVEWRTRRLVADAWLRLVEQVSRWAAVVADVARVVVDAFRELAACLDEAFASLRVNPPTRFAVDGGRAITYSNRAVAVRLRAWSSSTRTVRPAFHPRGR